MIREGGKRKKAVRGGGRGGGGRRVGEGRFPLGFGVNWWVKGGGKMSSAGVQRVKTSMPERLFKKKGFG